VLEPNGDTRRRSELRRGKEERSGFVAIRREEKEQKDVPLLIELQSSDLRLIIHDSTSDRDDGVMAREARRRLEVGWD